MAEPSIQQRWWGHVGGADKERLVTIENKARAAWAANNTFIAIANPTAAQTAAHSKVLSRELNGVLRLLFGDFTTDDT